MTKLTPSDFLLSHKEKLQQLIAILSQEFDYVSVLGCDVFSQAYSVSTSGTSLTPTRDTQRGFVVRVFQHGGFSEYAFNTLNVEEVCQNIRQIAKEDRQIFLNHHTAVHYCRLPEDTPHTCFHVAEVEHLPEHDDPKIIISTLQHYHDVTKPNYPEVVQLGFTLIVTQVNKIFLSTNRDLYQSYAYANGRAFAVAQDKNSTKVDFFLTTGLCGSELLKNMSTLGDKACQSAISLLTAEKIEPGEYDIICDPDFTGLIAHEAFGHGAEMDMFVKKRAKGAEFLHKRVASNKVNMHDGAKSAQEVSSYWFDDEGNLGTDTLIIENGILNTGICDELSAILLGIQSTGNGKRESYKRKAYTRMTNTFFAEGNDNLDDMIASIKKGYLLERCSSGMEDPKNWGIQCVANKGLEIIDGKLTGKVVSPVYLTGYVPDLLQSITMVSKGLELFGSGYCGKGWKEWVKTSTGGSYIKAKGRLS